jgi:hypothetical protein
LPAVRIGAVVLNETSVWSNALLVRLLIDTSVWSARAGANGTKKSREARLARNSKQRSSDDANKQTNKQALSVPTVCSGERCRDGRDGPAAVLGLRNETSSELLEQCDSLRLTNQTGLCASPDAHKRTYVGKKRTGNGAHMLSRSLCDRTTFVALSSTNHMGA